MTQNSTEAAQVEMVTITLDGNEVQVPQGTNLVEAAKLASQEIPHYCYHPDLSVPGNCRMCQVEVEGIPKLVVGCATPVREGMVVKTHLTSQKVKDTQAETLELILINHPLDCTVCDQAGHCKLQDYHYEYNAKSSRFLENKVNKVKAESLGPTVMLDGERCIMCTRCIRFCDEVTETSELGMLNRGDQSVIAVDPSRPLDNALSGTVVDLCPVGALTHKEWRFNTRIWYTDQKDGVCTGCSTGCNVKVATRDDQIVQVKARYNGEVNKEWLCDEGRYGFNRFRPESRVTEPAIAQEKASWAEAAKEIKAAAKLDTIVFVAPNLLLEDYVSIKRFLDKRVKKHQVVLAYRGRQLDPVQAKLVSPDHAANYRGAQLAGLVDGALAEEQLEQEYDKALGKLRVGAIKSVLVVGDRGILKEDLDAATLSGFSKIEFSAAFIADAESDLNQVSKVILPTRSVLEQAGLLVNRTGRLQFTDSFLEFPLGSQPVWRIFDGIWKGALDESKGDRQATLALLKENSEGWGGVTLKQLKRGTGIQLPTA